MMGTGAFRRSVGVAVSLWFGMASSAIAEEAPESPQPRATMHEVLTAISELLPLALDEELFAQPEQHARISQLLDTLATSVDHLNTHAESRDAGFRFLSRSLGSDVSEARARFAVGQTEGARFFVTESMKKCVVCHSRLPSQRDFPIADKLTGKVDLDTLSASEKARIQVVTRRFQDALTTWEAHFADPAIAPTRFDFSGDILDYLTVAIRVVRDESRADRTLAQIQKRKDVPDYMAKQLAAWRQSLADYAKLDPETPALDRARLLIGPSDEGEIRGGQKHLVGDLLASSLLLQQIDSPDFDGPPLAEAYYLLGFSEARTVEAFWVPQAEFHLEMSIRTDPKGPNAKPAFDLLKRQLELGYGGSAGVHLPTDVWVTLNELKLLMERKE